MKTWIACAVLALVGACDDPPPDTAEAKAAKAECHEVFKHIVSVSPEGKGQDADKVAAALPIEDVQGCVAAEPEMRACILAATDAAGVKKCIPSDAVLECMHTASAAKQPDIRAKCWAGDAKAAAGLKHD